MTTASVSLKLPVLLATDRPEALGRLQRVAEPVALQLAAPAVPTFAGMVVSRSGRLPLPRRAPHPIQSCSPLSAETAIDCAAVEVAIGRMAAAVLRQAHQLEAGLVVVRGEPSPERITESEAGSDRGSSFLAATVARYAPCHVLVDRGTGEPPWRHVLLVIDSFSISRSASAAALRALAVTQQLIPSGIERITVLGIQPPLKTHYLFSPFATATSWQLSQALQASQREQGQFLARQVAAALNGVVTTLVQSREPGRLICQLAAQQQVDAIVLGSDSRRTLAKPARQRRLTATASVVLHHAACPVLLCRAAQSFPNQPDRDRL